MSTEYMVDAAVTQAVADRKVSEIMHFTTNRGLLGILVEREVKSRSLLSESQYLEKLYTPNANYRREAPEWWPYVNLSIDRVNARFFEISRNWHLRESLFWVVLSFGAQVLTHQGVYFAPTNMAYDGIKPALGVAGFDALYADQVPAGWGRVTVRRSLPDNLTTCPQAEALYPQTLSTTHLQAIYAVDERDAAAAEGIVGTVDHDDVPVIVRPDVFRAR